MEYVQKAIELARKQRGKKAGQGDQRGSARQSAKMGQQALEPKDSSAVSVRDISYTESRKIELNPKTLIQNRVVAAFDNDQRGEPYRQLRTQILKEFRKNNWRTLAITSAHTGAGKTLTAVNIAMALAKDENQTVLLVDLDFKSPSMVSVLGLDVEMGLVEYLKDTSVSMSDVMINPGMERLILLPALPVSGPTSEILSSPRMKVTLKEMVEHYPDRLIIFDLPPLLQDDDALVFTPYVDATLLVVEQGVTQPHDIERCIQLLQGTSIIGTVLNKVV